MRYQLALCILLLGSITSLSAKQFGRDEAMLAGKYLGASAQLKYLSESECRPYSKVTLDMKNIIEIIVKEYPAKEQGEMRKVFQSVDLSESRVFPQSGNANGLVKTIADQKKLTHEEACKYLDKLFLGKYLQSALDWKNAANAINKPTKEAVKK